MHTLESAELVEMENDDYDYDDNGPPSCDQNGEDDNGVVPNFKDGRSATELQISALEKREDTGGTIEDFREQDNTSKQNESQFASTSTGDGVSPSVEVQDKVICGAVDQDCGADRPINCSTGRSNGGNQDETNEKQVTIEQSIDPDAPGPLSAVQEDCKDLTSKNVGGQTRQPPSDEATIEGCIGGPGKTFDDELSQTQKTSSDIKESLTDIHEDEVKTDEEQTYEDKSVDCFDTGITRTLPAAATGKEDASSSRREMFPALPDSAEEFDPGKDDRKKSLDFSHQDGKAREIKVQREEGSSDVADCGSTEKNGKRSGNKTCAKGSIFPPKMNFLVIAIFCLSFSVTRGAMALTVIPRDVLAASGSTARLRCSTNYKNPVYWDRKLFGSDAQETIYYGKNGMARIAGDRIKVEEDSSSGRYDLIISNVRMEDAGTYTCIDEAGIGDTYPAELVVFERFTCEMPVPHNGFMGENIFEIPEDPVESTCSLSFRGSVVPRFQWTWGKVTRLMTQSTSINGSTVTSSVTSRATHDMNGARLTCLPIVSTDGASLDDSTRWISETVVVRYVHVMFGSVDECQSNAMIPVCNPNCTYKVQETPDNRCQCLAVYNDQERTCNKIFSEYSCEISESSSQAIIVVVAIVVSIAVLAAVAIVLIVVGLRKPLCNNRRHPDEEKSGLQKPQKSNQSSTDSSTAPLNPEVQK